MYAAPGAARAQQAAAIGPVELFAAGLDGPEGLAFSRDGGLIVGNSNGDVVRFAPDGSATLLANVGEPLAGIAVLRDKRILAASFAGARVWGIQAGTASVVASGIPGANYVVETKRRQILVSSSTTGNIVDISGGTPVVRASGLSFPNGLALDRRNRYLYVAETFLGRIVRLPLASNGALGAPEVWATGLPLADGIAFDRDHNLLVVGGGAVRVVIAATGEIRQLVDDPLLNWPSNLAFGKRAFRRRNVQFRPGAGRRHDAGAIPLQPPRPARPPVVSLELRRGVAPPGRGFTTKAPRTPRFRTRGSRFDSHVHAFESKMAIAIVLCKEPEF